MTGFLLKKFFFDVWDNLFRITVLNFGFLLSLLLVFFLPPLLPVGGIILLIVLIFWLFVYLCAYASILKEVSDYRRPYIDNIAATLKNALIPAAVLFTVSALIFFILGFTVPVYLDMGNLPGMAAAFFSCWICLFLLAIIQFYPAVYYRLGRKPLTCLKKSAVVFFDNAGFCFFTLAVNTILAAIVFFCPGWSLLYTDQALRLRLFKYDWLESQPENHGTLRERSKIPWDQLLAEEKEKTGTRSLRSFLFPWKY